MGGKPVGIVLLVFACVGCHACQDCCDYLPPVADGPYAVSGQRAGSAFAGLIDIGSLPDLALSESELIDARTPAKDSHSAAINQTLRELLAIDD